MKIIDIVRRSGRNLKTAKLRTILTALAIGVGGFTLALTLAAGNGVRDYTSKLIASNFDPAELVVGRDKEIGNTGSPSDKPQEYDPSVVSVRTGGQKGSLQLKQVTQADVESLKANPLIEQVRENYQLNISYITRPGQKKFTGNGMPYNPAQKPEVKAGMLARTGDINKGTILIPDSYLVLLGFTSPESAIGQEIQLNVEQPFSIESLQSLLQNITNTSTVGDLPVDKFTPKQQVFTYKIGAVIKKSATAIGFGVVPVQISATDAKEIYDFTTKGSAGYQEYLYVYARVKDGTNDAKLQVAQKDLINKGFYVQSSKDVQKSITQFVNILQALVGIFGVITLFASVFGVVNTQYISVLERTREIGMMKALGMSRRAISLLFITEAAWIGFLGGALGIIGGFALGKGLNPWVTKKLDLGAGNSLIIFKPLQLLVLLTALMLIAAIAGLLPSRKAANLDPVEALRTE